ncbi:hypothetical protein GCM10011494_21310 [Novosphingobium endophyticum]|uniref:Uncharacterized protein n=1 Tax=Novosphingobium endophyticum TaxID=1955250 RepID=A0A916TSG9_9SPHN|nr:hypothetical protein [Novosphingobium endophyticum]GGC02486.1 hypothetical protein GCM10011494_21310 [Novosphingobium endophyticum]
MADFGCGFDFVVVGSDADKSVLILEKIDKLGGSTARSGGAIAISEGLEAASVETPVRRRAYVENGAPMVDPHAEWGTPLTRWLDYYDERLGGSLVGQNALANDDTVEAVER